MNTGVQRSGSTPLGASTATTPGGKIRPKKNMPKILEAHGIPYVATANGSYPLDLYEKFQKARDIKGAKYIHILSACPPGWGYDPKDTIKVGKLANETGFWPLYEIINGKLSISKDSKKYLDPSKRKPIEEYLKTQKRFNSIGQKELEEYRRYIDDLWKEIKMRIESQ